MRTAEQVQNIIDTLKGEENGLCEGSWCEGTIGNRHSCLEGALHWSVLEDGNKEDYFQKQNGYRPTYEEREILRTMYGLLSWDCVVGGETADRLRKAYAHGGLSRGDLLLNEINDSFCDMSEQERRDAVVAVFERYLALLQEGN